MKLPQLLSQYLYQKRQMDLPGIGSFTLDAGAVIPQESDRIGQVPALGISFKNANIHTADDALIVFIKEHTNKMKSLAAADLDFYLTTGRQLLNIGKPFYLEGIGTLIKNKDGRLDFTPGEYLVARLGDTGSERRGATSFDEAPREETKSPDNRQAFLLVGLIAGLILIGWGGYYLYKRNNFVEPSSAENRATVIPDTPAKSPDTAAAKPADTTTAVTPNTAAANTPVNSDTTHTTKPVPPAPVTAPPAPAPAVVQHTLAPADGQNLYHFVILRTENKEHALRRYNQLLGYQLNIHIDQKDSTFFKLYFPIAAVPGDTTHIRDSLADVYASRVTIEK